MPRKGGARRPPGESTIFRSNRWRLMTMRQLAGLSVAELRAHMKTEFRELPLLSQVHRRQLWNRLRRVPPRTVLHSSASPLDEDEFWTLVGRADAQGSYRAARQWISEYALQPSWRRTAPRVLDVLNTIRTSAQRALKDSLRPYWRRWKRNDTDHSVGLTALVRDDGLHEPWVLEAIDDLRRQQIAGAPDHRKIATRVLKEVGAALWQVGKGQTKKLADTPDRRRRKTTQRAIATYGARLAKAIEKERARPGLDRERFTDHAIAANVFKNFIASHSAFSREEVTKIRSAMAQQLAKRGIHL